MTGEASGQDSADRVVVEVYEETAERPIAGGRWEILADDTVRYRRPNCAEGLEADAVAARGVLYDSG